MFLFSYWVVGRLYFAQIALGSPPKNYYVQVDTGSDILWVNCVTCQRCPKKSDIQGVIFIEFCLMISRSAILFCGMIVLCID